MGRSGAGPRRRWSGGALAALLLSSGLAPARPDPAAIDRAWRAGAACLARDLDGAAFRDPYLTFVYPEEALPSPPGAPPLTYRKIDADTILVLLAREGEAPPELAGMATRARRDLEAAAPLFEKAGLSNVGKGARAGGVALDTFCVVGWLQGDTAMARAAARSIDGDRWLPGGLYDDAESFRAIADECWCLRLLASRAIDPASWRPVLDRIAARVLEHAAAAPGDRGTFYEVWHLGMALRAIDAGHPAIPVLLDALRSWAAAHRDPEGQARSEDLFEWINLAAADLLRPAAAVDLRDEAMGAALRAQDDGGCWRVPGERTGSGASFLTLRAMLAIATYRRDATRGPVPAPAPAP